MSTTGSERLRLPDFQYNFFGLSLFVWIKKFQVMQSHIGSSFTGHVLFGSEVNGEQLFCCKIPIKCTQ